MRNLLILPLSLPASSSTSSNTISFSVLTFMASSHPTTTSKSADFHHPPTYRSNLTTANTTFVQADPFIFRAVVKKLTGASDDPSSHKLPLTLPSRLSSAAAADVRLKKPGFKLHERRHAARKMDLSIGVSQRQVFSLTSPGPSSSTSSSSPLSPSCFGLARGSTTVAASPLSPLEMLEERAIAEKGFFLHPIPMSTPRGSQPPELLPLFPLHSPSHNNEATEP